MRVINSGFFENTLKGYFLNTKNFWEKNEKEARKGTKISADRFLEIKKLVDIIIINFALRI